ncbi:PD40 domain-containing protein [Candidatus Poribacteria bacterium]|nr:PD40 domain-containing protein [Candidatus Poribacteria bacterium]
MKKKLCFINSILFILIIFCHPCSAKELKILFNTNVSGNSNIYSIDIKNPSSSKKLTNSKDYEFWPRWSTKAQKIVYCSMPYSDTGPGKSKIWIMDADGKNNEKLTNGDYDDFFPNWSPDGEKIVFQSYAHSNGEIYIMDLKNKEIKRLTDDSFEDSYPSFYPDGKKIIYQSKREKKIRISVMNIDGTDKQFIFPEDTIENLDISSISPPEESRGPGRIVGGNNELEPAFSSDGKKIYFLIDNFNLNQHLYEYDSNMNTIRLISNQNFEGAILTDKYFSISKEGLILISSVSHDISLDIWQLYLVNADNNITDRIKILENYNIWFPSWME